VQNVAEIQPPVKEIFKKTPLQIKSSIKNTIGHPYSEAYLRIIGD
jgi:hypothetical protein